jgi:hypothetical protein
MDETLNEEKKSRQSYDAVDFNTKIKIRKQYNTKFNVELTEIACVKLMKTIVK